VALHWWSSWMNIKSQHACACGAALRQQPCVYMERKSWGEQMKDWKLLTYICIEITPGWWAFICVKSQYSKPLQIYVLCSLNLRPITRDCQGC
jgi:hypothetical protein